MIVYVAVVSGVTLPTTLYPDFQSRWGLSTGEVTGLYALYPVGVLLVLLCAGHWADEVGRRPVVAVALVCSALSSLLFVTAVSPWMAAAARVLTGLASGFVVNGANALLVELAPAAGRRRASIASAATNQAGLGLGAVVSAGLVQYAWAPEHLVFAVHLTALTLTAGIIFSVPETIQVVRRPTMQLRGLRLPLAGRPEFLSASGAAFAAFALCGLLAALAPTMVRSGLHRDSPLLSGAAVALVFFASAATQAFWGHWSDRTVFLSGVVLMLVALATLAAGVAGGSVVTFLAGVGIGGAAVGALFLSSLAIVNAVALDDTRASTLGLYFVFTFSGLIVPVVATGVAVDHMSQAEAVSAFAVGIAAVTIASTGLFLVSSRRATR